MDFRFSTPDLRMRLSCPLPGEFTVANASVAAAAALALGIAPRQIREALDGFPGVPGRLERVPDRRRTVLGFHRLCAHARCAGAPAPTFHGLCREPGGSRKRPGRIILLFGCGGDRDRSKRRLMARIASRLADAVVITSDNSRNEDPAAIIRDIWRALTAKASTRSFRTGRKQSATRSARRGRATSSCYAAKGHETYEIDRTGRHPFDERAVVREALRSRGEE